MSLNVKSHNVRFSFKKRLFICLISLFSALPAIATEETICLGSLEDIEKLISDASFDINNPLNEHASPLIKAIECSRDIEVLSLLVQKGADVNQQIYSGTSPTYKALEVRDNIPVFKFLIENGANKNNALFDVFEKADYEHFEELTDYLLKKGADVNARYAAQERNGLSGKHGEKLLTYSMRELDLDRADYLIQNGFDVNAKNGEHAFPVEGKSAEHQQLLEQLFQKEGGTRPLIHAVHVGDAEGYLFLLEKGADKSLQDNQGKLAEDYIKNNPRFQEKLKKAQEKQQKRQAKINALKKMDKLKKDENGYTPFEMALTQYNTTADDLELLYDEKIQINPDIWPVQQGIADKKNMFRFFMKKNILPFSQKNKDRMICEVLNDLSSRLRPVTEKEAVEVVKFLMHHGADVSGTNQNGKPVLSCGYLDYESVNNIQKLLIENGAKLEGDNFSFLFDYLNYCTEVRCVPAKPDFVKYLLSKGADVNKQVLWYQQKMTPLLGALKTKQSKEVLQILVDAGADVNARGPDEMTPLIIAARQNDADALEILLGKNADVNLLDRYKKNALHYLELNKQLIDSDVYRRIKEQTKVVLETTPITETEVEALLEKELSQLSLTTYTAEQKDGMRFRYYLNGNNYPKALELFSKPFVEKWYEGRKGSYFYMHAYLDFMTDDYPAMIKNYNLAVTTDSVGLKRALMQEWLVNKKEDFLHFYTKILKKNPELKEELIQLLQKRLALVGSPFVKKERRLIEALKQMKISDSSPVKTDTDYREYFDNSFLRLEVPLKDGKKNGLEKQYNEQFFVVAKIPFTAGQKNGMEFRYKYNPQIDEARISAAVEYKNNEGIRYDKNKQPIAKHVYQEDETTLVYNNEGKLIARHDKYGHFTNLTDSSLCCDFEDKPF